MLQSDTNARNIKNSGYYTVGERQFPEVLFSYKGINEATVHRYLFICAFMIE